MQDYAYLKSYVNYHIHRLFYRIQDNNELFFEIAS